MTAAWLIAVALLLLLLGLLLPPLLRPASPEAAPGEGLVRGLYRARSQELEADLDGGSLAPADHARVRDELARQLIEELDAPADRPLRTVGGWRSWGVAAALSVGLPLAAAFIYLAVGNPHAAAEQTLAARPEGHGDDLEGAVRALAQRLRSEPDDLPGWIVLARSYERLDRFDEAAAAYRQALALAPELAPLHADLADAIASARGGDLGGPAGAAIDKALALDPDQPKALALAGTAALGRGDLEAARRHWEHLHGLLPAGSPDALRVEGSLQRLGVAASAEAPGTGAAQAQVQGAGTAPRAATAAAASPAPGAGVPVAAGGAPSPAGPAATPAPARVTGTVRLAPAQQQGLQPEDTVFVLARSRETGRVPLAVLRLRVKDLPAAFVLDDSLAMSPALRLSSVKTFVVEARVSRSGGATPQSGDRIGTSPELAPGASAVELVIDQALP